MRTIDEEAHFILSDAGATEQLRRLATTVLERADVGTIEDARIEAEVERDEAVTRAEGLQRDLEADRRHSAEMRKMLKAASELLSHTHNTHAVEWRAVYLACDAAQRG